MDGENSSAPELDMSDLKETDSEVAGTAETPAGMNLVL